MASSQNSITQNESPFSQEELIRIMMQALKKMGMERTLKTLENESNVLMEIHQMDELRSAVLQGHWDQAITAFGQIADSIQLVHPLPLTMRDWLQMRRWGATKDMVKAFLRVQMYQEQFLEQLEQGRPQEAMKVLRERIMPQNPPPSVSKRLTRLLLCPSPEDVRYLASWPGTANGSRQKLLYFLELWFQPSDVLPSDRLDTLLRQALTYQHAQHPYHAMDLRQEPPSLLKDFVPTSDLFPRSCMSVLRGHSSEVWVVKVSHKGNVLASGGKDGLVILWELVYKVKAIAILYHKEPVSGLSWSPDDTKLLVTTEEDVVEWDLTNQTAKVFAEHEFSVTAVKWPLEPLPIRENRQDLYITGAMDGKVLYWSWGGRIEKVLDFAPYRVLGLDVSPNGQYMVVLGWKSPPRVTRMRNMTGVPAGPQPEETSVPTSQTDTRFMQQYNRVRAPGGITPNLHFPRMLMRLSTELTTEEGEEVISQNPVGRRREATPGVTSSIEAEPESEAELSDDCGSSFQGTPDLKPMRVWVWDHRTQALVHSIDFRHKFNYVTFSQDGRHVLLSQACGPVHMLDIQSGIIVQVFHGRQASSTVLRTAFAYQGDDFIQDIGTYVTSGSDDGQLCIWHRATGQLLKTVCHHPKGRVNDMAWCQGPWSLLATCGDDHTVHVWSPEEMDAEATECQLSDFVPLYHAPDRQGTYSHSRFEVHPIMSIQESLDYPANGELSQPSRPADMHD